MPSTLSTLTLETISDLRSALVSDGQLVLLVGINSVGDGRGGFYRWTANATDAEDTTFWNVVASNATSVGRWYRVFQRARSLPGGMVLVMNGGVKTLYCPGTVDGNGTVTVYPTMTGTAGGTAIFTEIWQTAGEAQVNMTNANDLIFGGRQNLAANLTSLTYRFARGATTVVSILGAAIPGLRDAPAGTPVIIRIDGV